MYGFTKSKLRRGQSFPLKRSILDLRLEEHAITHVWSVYYFTRTGGDIVMRADCIGESSHHEWDAAGKVSITIYAVPSAERHATERMLVEEGLPILCQWISATEYRGSVWRAVRRAIIFHYAQGQLRVEEHEG